jgi:transposase-like protein
MMYVKYLLSLRNVEDLLAERGIHVCYETVRPGRGVSQPTDAGLSK